MKSVSLINAAARPGTDTAARAAVSLTPAPRWDPRLYQIATLAGLLGYGVFWLDLEVQTPTAVAIVVTVLVARSLWLGEPLAMAVHRLENGALVLFAFFMISDPRTTPDSRAGRVLFATLVALGAYAVQFKLFRTNGLLWSLAVCSLLVPLIDRVLPGSRYQWRRSP